MNKERDYALMTPEAKHSLMGSCRMCCLDILAPESGKVDYLTDLIDVLTTERNRLMAEKSEESEMSAFSVEALDPSPSSTSSLARPSRVSRNSDATASKLRRLNFPSTSFPSSEASTHRVRCVLSFADLPPRVIIEHILAHLVVDVVFTLPDAPPPTSQPIANLPVSSTEPYWSVGLLYERSSTCRRSSVKSQLSPLILFGRFTRDPLRHPWFVFRSLRLMTRRLRLRPQRLRVPDRLIQTTTLSATRLDSCVCVVRRQLYYLNLIRVHFADSLPPFDLESLTMLEKLCLSSAQLTSLLEKENISSCDASSLSSSVSVPLIRRVRCLFVRFFRVPYLVSPASSFKFAPLTFLGESLTLTSIPTASEHRGQIVIESAPNLRRLELIHNGSNGSHRSVSSSPVGMLPLLPSLRELKLLHGSHSNTVFEGIGPCSLTRLELVGVSGLSRLPPTCNVEDLKTLILRDNGSQSLAFSCSSFRFVTFKCVERVQLDLTNRNIDNDEDENPENWLSSILSSGHLRRVEFSFPFVLEFRDVNFPFLSHLSLKKCVCDVSSIESMPCRLEILHLKEASLRTPCPLETIHLTSLRCHDQANVDFVSLPTTSTDDQNRRKRQKIIFPRLQTISLQLPEVRDLPPTVRALARPPESFISFLNANEFEFEFSKELNSVVCSLPIIRHLLPRFDFEWIDDVRRESQEMVRCLIIGFWGLIERQKRLDRLMENDCFPSQLQYLSVQNNEEQSVAGRRPLVFSLGSHSSRIAIQKDRIISDGQAGIDNFSNGMRDFRGKVVWNCREHDCQGLDWVNLKTQLKKLSMFLRKTQLIDEMII